MSSSYLEMAKKSRLRPKLTYTLPKTKDPAVQRAQERAKNEKEIKVLNVALETAAVHQAELQSALEAAQSERDAVSAMYDELAIAHTDLESAMTDLHHATTDHDTRLSEAESRVIDLTQQLGSATRDVTALTEECELHREKAERFGGELTRVLAAKQRDQAVAEFRAAQIKRAALGAWRNYEDTEAADAATRADLRRVLRLWRENCLLQRDGAIIQGVVDLGCRRRIMDDGRVALRAWRDAARGIAQQGEAIEAYTARQDRAVLRRAFRLWTRGRAAMQRASLHQAIEEVEMADARAGAAEARHHDAQLEIVRLTETIHGLNAALAAQKVECETLRGDAAAAAVEAARAGRRADDAASIAEGAERTIAAQQSQIVRLTTALEAKTEAAAALDARLQTMIEEAEEKEAGAIQAARRAEGEVRAVARVHEAEKAAWGGERVRLAGELDAALAVVAELRAGAGVGRVWSPALSEVKVREALEATRPRPPTPTPIQVTQPAAPAPVSPGGAALQDQIDALHARIMGRLG